MNLHLGRCFAAVAASILLPSLAARAQVAVPATEAVAFPGSQHAGTAPGKGLHFVAGPPSRMARCSEREKLGLFAIVCNDALPFAFELGLAIPGSERKEEGAKS